MATWVWTGTSNLNSVDANLIGTMDVDKGTTPSDFDPAAVNSVRFQIAVTGSSIVDDTWSTLREARVAETVSSSAFGGSTNGPDQSGLQNETDSFDQTDNSPNNGLTTVQWEAMEVYGGDSVSEDLWATYTNEMMPDGGNLDITGSTQVTITIDYDPATNDTFVEITEDVGVADSTVYPIWVPEDVDVTDSTTPVKASPRTSIDPVGVTDDVVGALTKQRSVIEAVGVTDLTTKSETGAEEVVEAVGLTDSVLHVDPTLQFLYPDGDILSGGWETAPTPGQDLADQLDEDPADDADYIFEEV